MTKYILYILLLASVSTVPVWAQKNRTSKNIPDKPKNIILMIGDGMGSAQVYAMITAKRDNTNIARCPVTGFVKTFSADNYITDSAAGATAFSTGTKTNNGYLGIDPLGRKLETILEKAEKVGLSTGLVVTCAITHATPAGFVAHNNSRGNYEEIAIDFLHKDVDVLIGGGYNHFANRKDGLNLIDSLKAEGYNVLRNLGDIDPPVMEKVAVFLADEHLPRMSAGRGDALPRGTELALKILKKNRKGFFMMVEGSQIDWGGHDNSLDYVVEETIDFDNAIGKALDFATKDGNTLVIITADHETGGLALTGSDFTSGKVSGNFLLKDHTGIMVPLFAFGPGSGHFSGIMDNTDVFKKCSELLNLQLSK